MNVKEELHRLWYDTPISDEESFLIKRSLLVKGSTGWMRKIRDLPSNKKPDFWAQFYERYSHDRLGKGR